MNGWCGGVSLLGFVALVALLANDVDAMNGESRVRMCPPGGSSFTLAWSMTCSMRRKRRDIDGSEYPVEQAMMSRPRRALVRPSMQQIKQICCDVGCTVQDMLPFCSPFF